MKFVRILCLLIGFCALSPAYAQTLDQTFSNAPVDAQDEPSAYSVTFASGKADIDASAMQILWGASHTTVAQSGIIRISGFTDAKGSATVNVALSQRRAEAVAAQLVKIGLDRSRMVVMGFGSMGASLQPATPENSRRVEISFEPGTAAPVAQTSSAAADSAPETAISVKFAPGKANVGAASLRKLKIACKGVSRSAVVQVSGYTDAKGSAVANQKLSQRRAHAVAAALVKMGFSRAHMTVKGFGSTVAHGDGHAASDDRRVDVVLSLGHP